MFISGFQSHNHLIIPIKIAESGAAVVVHVILKCFSFAVY